MEIRVRIPVGAIGNAVLEIDSPLCKLRGLARIGRIDIEGTLVSPEEDIFRIAEWMGQPSEPVRVKVGDIVFPIDISAIKDILVIA